MIFPWYSGFNFSFVATTETINTLPVTSQKKAAPASNWDLQVEHNPILYLLSPGISKSEILSAKSPNLTITFVGFWHSSQTATMSECFSISRYYRFYIASSFYPSYGKQHENRPMVL